MKVRQLFCCLCVFQFIECKKNVLFIIADDLRPQLGAYNGKFFPSNPHAQIYTPNLDTLASKSLLLRRAYVQQALCSPSRSSFMTGRRPDTTHVYDLDTYFRNVGGNFTTIPQYFKMNGYESVGMGKIFHPGKASNNNDPNSWTQSYFRGNHTSWEDHQHSWRGIPNHSLLTEPLQDQQVANHAVSKLKEFASNRKPFFMAVGFHKPHLPFVFPQNFMQHYPWASIHEPSNQYAPLHIPNLAWAASNELRSYGDIGPVFQSYTGGINSTLPKNEVIKLRRAYYACVTYMDSLVGQVISELSRLGLENDTIVSFVGDHGYKLGEHGAWTKHTNFDIDTHAPMMIRVPGLTDGGVVSDQLVEFVDLFPTIVEAAGITNVPSCPDSSTQVGTCHEGTSILPLINQPNTPLKVAAFSQYPRQSHHQRVMGYTVNTDRYRYTEWVKFQDNPIFKPDWKTIYGVELYDHQVDPNENINKASYSSMAAIKTQLQQVLHNGWRNAKTNHNQIPNIFG